jgi:hypothetical protein
LPPPAGAELGLVRSMTSGIPYSQYVAQLVGVALFIVGGVWCLFIWPRSIRRQIDRGEVDAFDGLAKLRKAPLYGYGLLLLAISDSITTLAQVDALPRNAFSIALVWVVMIAFVVVGRRLMRENKK